MAGLLSNCARRLAAGVLAAMFAAALPTWAQAEPPGVEPAEANAAPAPSAVAVFAPRAPASLQAIDGGVRLWIVQELRRSGVPVVAPAHADDVAARHLDAEHPFLRSSQAAVLAAETDAGAVLLTALVVHEGKLELWIRAFDAQGGTFAVGQGTGTVATLGEALVAATRPVLAALASSPNAAEPPRLGELGRYERALERLDAGAFADAWREVAELRSPTADALREDIVALAGAPDVPAAERSRLASLRGVADPDWLAVRHGLQRDRSAAMLLAGAEHAAAADDPDGALVLYGEAARAAPGDVTAEVGRARTLAALGRHEEAKVSFERVLELEPGDVEARLALAQNPALPAPQQAQHLLDAGILQSEALDDEGARSSFDIVANVDATLKAATRRHAARLEEALGEDGAALATWEEAAAADADDLEALAGLGRTRARSGDAEGASQAFGRVLERAPDHAGALVGYGQALVAQGRAAEAVPHLEKALTLTPRAADVRTTLASALQASGETDEALRVLDPSQVEPEAQAEVLEQSAAIQAEAGRLAEAQVTLTRAVEIEPDDAPLRTALARVHARSGNAEAAAAEEARAVALVGKAGEVATHDPSAAPAAGAVATVTGDEFANLVASFPTATPGRQPIRRVAWLGLGATETLASRVRAWLMPQRIDPAALDAALRAAFATRFQLEPLRPVPPAAERSLAALRAFGTESGDIALANDVLDVDATLFARFAPLEPEGWFDPPVRAVQIEVRLGSGRTTDAVWMFEIEAQLADASRYQVWNWRAGVSLAALFVLLMLPVLRGWGSLVVTLDYERTRGQQGFFSIELSRRPGRTKQQRSGSGRSRAAKYQRKARSWSRFVRHMVGRETRMSWLPARHWYVAVHGLLQDTATQEVIGNYLEERKVRVERGQALDVKFDFRRKAAPIEVRIQREEGAAAVQARVAVLGQPDSIRFVKDDSATVFLGTGKHTLLVALSDRVYERTVEVRELVGQVIPVGVDAPEEAVFSGCADAVEPYLLGDLGLASQRLEAAGQREPALTLRAEHHRRRGEAEAAARCLEQLGRFAEAAQLARQSPAPQRSADLFAKAGDFSSAAAEHARAGDPLAAARAHEAAFEYAAAIDAYRTAGEREKVLELLQKTGRFFEAGALALELAQSDLAIRCFQQVGPREPDYVDACEALASLFSERGELDLAVEKAREALEVRGGDDAPLDTQESYARLLERAGQAGDALAVWENIRKRDFQYRDASTKIEALRQSVAATQRATATPSATQAATVAAAPAAAGSESRYEVLGEIGRGGMGVVVKARDTRLGRVVALKRMPENLKSNPTAVQLFLREARAAAALSHPNIVTLFDAGQELDGSYYLTMELLEGFGLDTLLKKRGRLSARDTVRIGVQIAKGLQFAHEKGVVHRDIKTANLFFTQDRVVKIMDFGLAKMTEEVRRSATVIGGTPYYMAPEQAAGKAVDHRADLYALGVTLFELVTGSVPFRDGDVADQHRRAPVPDARSHAPDVPEALAALIQQLMAKKPADRPATTAEVVRALEKLLGPLGAAGGAKTS